MPSSDSQAAGKRRLPPTSAPGSLNLQVSTVAVTQIGDFWLHQRHYSPFWRLYHNDRPGTWIELNGERTELLPELLYAIPPATPFEGVRIDQSPWHFFVHFTAGPAFDLARPRLHTLAMSPAAASAVKELRERAHSRRLQDPRSQMMATFLVSYALLQIPPADLDAAAQTEPRVMAAIRQVLNNPDQPIHVEALAAAQGLGREAFSRLFRCVTGEPPHRHFMRLKLDRVRSQLETTAQSIDQIAAHNGFVDRHHLSRSFKATFGRSPAAHRRGSRLRAQG